MFEQATVPSTSIRDTLVLQSFEIQVHTYTFMTFRGVKVQNRKDTLQSRLEIQGEHRYVVGHQQKW